MVTTPLGEATVTEFRQRMQGDLLQPDDAGYDETRQVQNGMIDRRPALISRCLGTADVVHAVTFARTHDLEVSVRGGGHNVAGKAVCEGGLMIDLSLMKDIEVDPKARTVRAQGGVTWGEFNQRTQLHGLASTGGVVSTTGIAGLTLGGGIGWLMGKHGLAIDNLLSAEVVTANGDIVRASADENADLFWGLRGGGGNFGVVCTFEYQLHQVGPTVLSGLVAYPIERARDVLRFYRDFTASIPDELTVFAIVGYAPDGSGTPIVAIAACHCGDAAQAEAAVRPIRELGPPVMGEIGPTSYEQTNMMFDAGAPKGALNYWKSSFLAELNDTAIDIIVQQFGGCPPSLGGIFIEHFHGAATRVGETDTAFPQRTPGYNFLAVAAWLDPTQTKEQVAWARETYAAMQPHLASVRYVNYLDADEGEDPAAGAYGPNYKRLRSLKSKYDPANLFRMNQNIKPS